MATDVQHAEEASGEVRKRRRPPIVPILVLLAIIAGAGYLYLFRSQPTEQVRRLIDKQLKLSAGGLYERLWEETLSPGLKARCPLDAFTGSLQQVVATRPNFWTLIDYRNIHITVNGDRAIVTYQITYNGAPVESATAKNPDLYVRASQTLYGETVSKAEQLRKLEELRAQAVIGVKDYEKEKAEIERHGDSRRVLSIKGQWYDDLDSHTDC
jgi:hypothetical protein